MKFVASCLYVAIPIFVLGCNAAAPQVSITFTDLTQSDELTRTGTVQFTCIGTCLPYLQWFYNQTERIAEYSLINNSLHSFPLNLSILESSKLSNGAEVVMLNASQNPDTPLLADYSSMLTVHLTLLSQLGIYSIRCGTLNNYNETFINLNTTNACSIESLGSSLDVHLDEVCLSTDIGSVSIVNGTGCYSGTTAGSVVTYHCDNGYIISSGSEQRECRSDGNWEEEIPVCKEVVRLTVWNIVLTVFGPLLWLVAVAVTITGPATMCIRIEWWHGVYICQLVVEIILLVITAGLWIGFGATIGNIRSYQGDLFISRRNDLCVSAFVFSLLSLVWIVMAVSFVHVIPQCNVKKKTPLRTFEAEVEEEICGFDEEQSHKDSKPRSTTIEL